MPEPPVPPEGEFVDIPCMTFKQSGVELILFSASGKLLWDLCQINRRLEDKDEGYQRALSTDRQKRIAAFIDSEKILPTSVLISFDEATLRENGTILRIPKRRDAGWIIDGQHRIAGAHAADKDILFPSIAFIGLDIQEQILCFVTINREHKGVPSSLYLDLLKHLPDAKSEAEQAKQRTSDLAQGMKGDEESPFYGRIVTTTSPRRGQLSLTNFVRKIHPLVKRDGFLNPHPDHVRKRVVENYYRGLAQVFPKEYVSADSVFFKTIGFGALIGFLPFFFQVTQTRKNSFTVSDAVDTFRLIEDFKFEDWSLKGTGTQAENAATDELVGRLQQLVEATGNPTIRLE